MKKSSFKKKPFFHQKFVSGAINMTEQEAGSVLDPENF